MLTLPFRFLAAAACCAAALLSPSCSRETKLAYSCELSGVHSDTGVAGRNAALLAVEMLRERGERISIEARDDGGDPARAAEVDTALAGQGRRLVIGHTRSFVTAGSMAAAGAETYLLLSPYSNGAAVVGRDDFLFCLLPPARAQAEALADRARELGYGRAAVAYDETNLAYSEGFAKDFAARFEAKGGRVAASVMFQRGNDGHMGDKVALVAASRPETVLIVGSVVDTAIFSQLLRSSGFAGQFFGSDAAMEPGLARNGGAAVQGMIFAHIFDPRKPRPAAKAFAARFSERFNQEPSLAAYLGAEAVFILAEVAAKDDSPAAVKSGLLAGGFEGLIGPLRFDASGDAVRHYELFELRGEAFEALP
ncbi:MAG: ABC transporter substrate-binding protein [Spirochaetaceae bacterium]|nr:ABC transporter substrate-binding protein [Spirochaetaceae bacterium]